MPASNNEQQYQPLTFDAIKSDWLHRKRSWNGQEARLQSRRPLTIER